MPEAMTVTLIRARAVGGIWRVVLAKRMAVPDTVAMPAGNELDALRDFSCSVNRKDTESDPRPQCGLGYYDFITCGAVGRTMVDSRTVTKVWTHRHSAGTTQRGIAVHL